MNFNGMVFVTVLVVVGSTEAAHLTKGEKLSLSPVIAGFILGFFLYIFGLINVDLATKFSYVAIVAALLTNGASTFNAITPKK